MDLSILDWAIFLAKPDMMLTQADNERRWIVDYPKRGRKCTVMLYAVDVAQ